MILDFKINFNYDPRSECRKDFFFEFFSMKKQNTFQWGYLGYRVKMTAKKGSFEDRKSGRERERWAIYLSRCVFHEFDA